MFRIILSPSSSSASPRAHSLTPVTLSNGEKLTGKIISKTDTEVTMSVRFPPVFPMSGSSRRVTSSRW
jgi:hypothetical protein